MISKFANIRLLVVDDHYIMRKTLKDMLRALGYNEILQAGSGKEALELIKVQHEAKAPVHLIVTDWMMNDGTGIELIYNLKSTPDFYNIPVIMITGEMMKNNIARALLYGADSYLIKPFQLAELDRQIDALINRYAYPNEEQQMLFSAERFFLTKKYREAVGLYVKIHQKAPSQKTAWKIAVCLEALGESEKAQQIILEQRTSDFLPILRDIKRIFKTTSRALSSEEMTDVLRRKIQLEWSEDEAIDDTLMLADLLLAAKDLQGTFQTLMSSPDSWKRRSDIGKRIDMLCEKFPFLRKDSDADSRIINRGIRYFNDIRIEMRRLKSLGKLAQRIEELRSKLEFVPGYGDWIFELGVALLESGDDNAAVQLIEAAMQSNEAAYNSAEIGEYLLKIRMEKGSER